MTKKTACGALVAEDVQDARREARVRPVVEGQDHLLADAAAAALDDVGGRVGVEALGGDEPAVRVEGHPTRSVARRGRDLQHFPFAFVVEVVAVVQRLERFRGRGVQLLRGARRPTRSTGLPIPAATRQARRRRARSRPPSG